MRPIRPCNVKTQSLWWGVFVNLNTQTPMSIENINTGICRHRIQAGQPPFFVNWTQDGVNMYEFFSLRFACEDFKNRLTQKQGILK